MPYMQGFASSQNAVTMEEICPPWQYEENGQTFRMGKKIFKHKFDKNGIHFLY